MKFTLKLAALILLVWGLIFGGYELIERLYLQDAGPGTLHLLHLLRGSGTAFLLAFLGARAVYRRREAVILEAKGRLESEKIKQDGILSEIGAGLIVLDADFNVDYANAQAQKWFGAKPPGRLCAMSDCPIGQSTGLCAARETSLRQGRFSFEEQIETREGPRHLFITATPLPPTNGGATGGIIELIQDITPLKEMEARLRSSVAAARVGAISSGIAHQLGGPLAAISAALERLHSLGASKQEAYARYLQRIEIESDRSARIVRSLMDLARRGNGAARSAAAPAGANVRYAVLAAIDAVAERRGKPKDAVKLYLPQTDPMVRMDVTDVQEVLVNLLENAFEATLGRDSSRISIHVAEDRGNALVMVCDNGPGVDAAFREKIFEPFYTTRKNGTGLGLYVCREIVESGGGEIRVDNLPPGGARFLIRMPSTGSAA